MHFASTAGILVAARGVGLFLFLCTFTALIGRGLVRLLRLRLEESAAAVLGPVLTFLFWSLALAVGAGVLIPIQCLAPWLAAVSLLLAVGGAWRPWPSWRTVLPLLLAALLPLLLMAGCFRHGITEYTGSVDLDGWTYMAGGRYLWGHTRYLPDTAALCLLDRVGSYFCGERYLSFTFLGFLSPLIRAGDTRAVLPLYQAWVLYCMGCGVFLFWLSDGQPRWLAAAGTALTVLSGWMGTVLWGNNLDQLLSLTYMPAMAAVVYLLPPQARQRWLLLGGLFAGVWYTYPECAPFICAGAGLSCLPRLWQERGVWRSTLRGLGLAVLLAAILLLPAAPTLAHFAGSQYSRALHNGGHGFEMYRGMLDWRHQPAALWGLGGETYAKPFTALKEGWAVFLSLALLVGLPVLARRQRWGMAAAVVLLLSGVVALLVVEGYPYGAYKLLSVTWWAVVFGAFAGLSWILGRLPGSRPRVVGAACLLAAGVCLGFLANRTEKPLWPRTGVPLPASAYRHIQAIRLLVGRAPVLLAVDDWLASLLAVYHLRDVPLWVGSPRSWLADPLMAAWVHADATPPDDLRFVLTGADPGSENGFVHHGRPVWSAGPYRLWRVERGKAAAVVVHFDNPFGVGRDADGDFAWLGTGEAALYVWARHAGVLRLDTEIAPGPSRPDQAEHHLTVSTGTGYRAEAALRDGPCSITVPARAGMNRIALRCLDAPKAAVAGAPDLLLRVKPIRPRLVPAEGPSDSEANESRALLPSSWQAPVASGGACPRRISERQGLSPPSFRKTAGASPAARSVLLPADCGGSS